MVRCTTRTCIVAVLLASKALATVVAEEGFDTLDALKVDVEGAEDLVLDPFFRSVEPRLWPRLLIVDNASAPAMAFIAALANGAAYRRVLQTRSNDVFERCA